MKTHTHSPLFLMAGNPRSRRTTADPLIRSIIRRIGIADPHVAYLGCASGDNKQFFERISGALTMAGVATVTLAATVSKTADISKARTVIKSADIVFMSGGDVQEGMSILHRTGLSGFLTGLFKQGKPFAGVSAGSIMLSRQWICWPDENDDSRIQLIDCLGCAPVHCDTHAEDDDWQELKALLKTGPAGMKGYGIPAGGCLIVEPDGQCSAMAKPIPVFSNINGSVKQNGELRP